jgi:hypothetical protein
MSLDWVISALCIILASYYKGKMDTIMFTPNANIGWKNKWKLTSNGKLIRYGKRRWYHYIFKQPKYEEKFPLSSTVLVCFTDNWHRYQFITLRLFFLSVCIHLTNLMVILLAVFIIAPILYGIGFNYSYRKNQ